MSLQGKAFLCIWNDHDPAQMSEYEAWHTFEHVPERACVPGFLSGRRYADYDRPEGRYLTVYDIENLGVLDTPAYRDLQRNPTEWSSRMRRSFRNFLRIPSTMLVSGGRGCAAAIGALVFRTKPDQADAVAALTLRMRGLMDEHRVTAYRLGCASEIPAYAVFDVAQSQDADSVTYTVLLEGLTTAMTDGAIGEIAGSLLDLFDGVEVLKSESSGFLFKVEATELEHSRLRRGTV